MSKSDRNIPQDIIAMSTTEVNDLALAQRETISMREGMVVDLAKALYDIILTLQANEANTTAAIAIAKSALDNATARITIEIGTPSNRSEEP